MFLKWTDFTYLSNYFSESSPVVFADFPVVSMGEVVKIWVIPIDEPEVWAPEILLNCPAETEIMGLYVNYQQASIRKLLHIHWQVK